MKRAPHPATRRGNRQREEGERGASLVEFALILPIFAILLFGLIDFGLVFGGFTSLRSGTGAGARDASVNFYDPGCTTGTDTQKMVCTIEKRIGTPTGTTGSVTVNIVFPDVTSPATPQIGNEVEVCTSVAATSSTGLTRPFLSGTVLHSSSTFRLEQTPTFSSTGTCS